MGQISCFLSFRNQNDSKELPYQIKQRDPPGYPIPPPFIISRKTGWVISQKYWPKFRNTHQIETILPISKGQYYRSKVLKSSCQHWILLGNYWTNPWPDATLVLVGGVFVFVLFCFSCYKVRKVSEVGNVATVVMYDNCRQISQMGM